MKKILVVITLMFGVSNMVFAGGKTETVKIQTSSVCDMCKETIEGKMAFEKGVKKAVLDVSTGILTIEYNPKKTNPDVLRISVSMVGYDADDVPADSVAYENLHGCCKKDAHK